MHIHLINSTLAFLQNSTEVTQPDPAAYWWLAFAPIVVTAIFVYIIRWGMLRFLHGDRFIGKLFGVTEEEQRAKMIEFREKSLERIKEKEREKAKIAS